MWDTISKTKCPCPESFSLAHVLSLPKYTLYLQFNVYIIFIQILSGQAFAALITAWLQDRQPHLMSKDSIIKI